jgi:hypothetical protein
LIGPPTPWLSDEEAAYWLQFAQEAPYLRENHRALLELACTLRSMLRKGTASTSDRAQYLSALRALGMTPTDEARVATHIEEDEDDEFD